MTENVFKRAKPKEIRTGAGTTYVLENKRGRLTLHADFPENIKLCDEFERILLNNDYETVINYLRAL